MKLLLCALLSVITAMTHWQIETARQLLRRNGAPQFSAVIDAVQRETIAFTDQLTKKTYIDASRLESTPNVFASILTHECGHLRGMEHNSIPGHPMNFSVSIDARGHVVEVDHVWSF